MTHQYYTYIITNKHRTTFYIGVTNNLLKRIDQHKAWEIDGFSKTYKTNILLYYEQFNYIDKAIVREKQLKKRSRIKKLNLIQKNNPNLDELYYDQ